MAKIKNPWGDRRDCDVSDNLCSLRRCLHIGEDKGAYTPGVGYTSYRKVPLLVCMTRHLHGCPYPHPDPEPEMARCCPSPDFAKTRSRVHRQRCRTCGTWSEGKALEIARSLPRHPATRCKHASIKQAKWTIEDCWLCPERDRWFDEKPEPHQVGESHTAFSERRMTAWKTKMSF